MTMTWDGNPVSFAEACLEILRATHDGEDLAPTDLKLVERMVNAPVDEVSEAMEVAFLSLYQRVKRGYTKPWFHGIEHLTIDYVGYVYWKGVSVDHYEPGWAFSAKAKMAAEEIARRCRLLESRGEVVNTVTAVWKWQDTETIA